MSVLSPLPISVVVVARNEAHNLPRCFGSVRGWVAELVVVINNCNDRTEAVAREHGAVVFETEWRGVRETKNWALRQARQPWVLCLDADEEVSVALQDDIRAFFARGDHHRCNGARFPRKAWFLNRWITHGDWYPDLSLRLVNRAHARWDGGPSAGGQMRVEGRVATLAGDLHHYPVPTLSSYVARFIPAADFSVQQQQEQDGRFRLAAAVWAPLWRFVRGYVLRGGFLDGYPGFCIARASAFGAFIRYSRLYEHEHRKSPPRSESPFRGWDEDPQRNCTALSAPIRVIRGNKP